MDYEILQEMEFCNMSTNLLKANMYARIGKYKSF